MLTEASALPAQCTAPPSGLFLAQVLYEGDRLAPLTLPPFPLLPPVEGFPRLPSKSLQIPENL